MDHRSMRDRVETGIGLLFVFGLGGVVAWWWHGHTSAVSLWWIVTLAAAIVCAIGIGRGAQLFLSGWSGFGRNFHEDREPCETDDDSEAAVPLSPPTVLVISGVIVLLLKLFPGMNSAQEFSPDHWVSPRLLVPWMFIAGFVTAAWSAVLLAMMKTGPDRWAHVPGTRDEIRQVSKVYLALGVVLMVIAVAAAVAEGEQDAAGSGPTSSYVAVDVGTGFA